MFASGQGVINLIAILALAAFFSLLALVGASLIRRKWLLVVGGPILIGWGLFLFFGTPGASWMLRFFFGVIPVAGGTIAFLRNRKTH